MVVLGFGVVVYVIWDKLRDIIKNTFLIKIKIIKLFII